MTPKQKTSKPLHRTAGDTKDETEVEEILKPESENDLPSHEDKLQDSDAPPKFDHPILGSPRFHAWLKSRTDSQVSGGILAPGQDRRLTVKNILLAFSILPLIYVDLVTFFLKDNPLRMLAFVFSGLVLGFLPAFKVWTSSRLLDIVQESFSSAQPPDRQYVLFIAASSWLASSGNTLFNFLTSSNEMIIRTRLDILAEKMYMSAQLSMDIPTLSDPLISALVYEAGCFAGFEGRMARPRPLNRRGRLQRGMPFAHRRSAMQTMHGLFSSLTAGVECITAGTLLIHTIGSAENISKWIRFSPSGIPIPSETFLLLCLSFTPSVLSVYSTITSFTVIVRKRPGRNGSRTKVINDDPMARHVLAVDLHATKELGRNGSYKQEVILFDLKQWILSRWEELRNLEIETELESQRSREWLSLGLGMSEEAIQTAFYALLALRVFHTTISLGSLRLYQRTTETLLNSLRAMSRSVEESVQVIFYAAAFFEATEVGKLLDEQGRHGQPLVDYESTRTERGGMRIEARNLGFTYPGGSEPVLRDINLVIEPGTTLAIVGFNGGGKTTLVKVLMGLYDHTGDLLINGHPLQSYSSKQLHARTTCCFQDHSRYSLTLRENVGFGKLAELQNDEAIYRAIGSGGAEELAQNLGLEGKLNHNGVPDVGQAVASGSRPSREETGTKDEPTESGSEGGQQPTESNSNADAAINEKVKTTFMKGVGAQKSARKDGRTPLSGGQWSRVALSRAFMRADEADLVVFDEPSAALDARAEAELFNRIHSLSSGKGNGRRATTIYISHRFSTVRKADKIAVVENRTITELGDHASLMAMNGRYAEFFNLQKEGFD